MKKLFILALSATLAACQLSTDSDEAAKDVAQQWAEAFFNCDFHEAESCSTPESSNWLHFAAANTMPHDIDLLNERNAQVESVQLQHAGSDTLRTAVLKVRDYVRPTALGDAVAVNNDRQIVQLEGVCRHECFPADSFLQFSVSGNHVDLTLLSELFQP